MSSSLPTFRYYAILLHLGYIIGAPCQTSSRPSLLYTIAFNVSQYIFPTVRPMGWGYGEPHIVTLDGFQYTFNGKGEYTYIETTDKSFVIQCRLEHVAGSNGTVFTAIVAKTSTSEAVQLSVINSNDIELCVNGDVVDLSIIRWKQFAGVGLTRTKSGSVVASFTGDYFVEVKAEHDMLSIITMSLPDEVRGQTQGLMGNYNCDPSDDLIPKGMSEPIPANSSFEDVHYDFGLTCEFVHAQ